MLERNFQAKVIKYIVRRGGYVLNVAGGTQIPKGTPDLLVCWRGRFFALELKTDTGKTTELQKDKICEIRKAGGYARVLRPSDWESFKKELEDIETYDTIFIQ